MLQQLYLHTLHTYQYVSCRYDKNKKKLEVVQIKGLGGTVMMPAFEVVIEKFNQYNTVLLTDGYTDQLVFQILNGRVLIITTDQECGISSKPKKGIRQIVVDEKHH